jgi:hypothetical protein
MQTPQAFGSIVKVGAMVFVRTVTLYYVGKVKAIDGMGILLEDAAWVADQGSMSESLLTGKVKDSDYFPDPVFVNSGAVVDITSWRHAPLKSKK